MRGTGPAASGATDAAAAILTRIRGLLPSLRPAERRVADVVLADPLWAAARSITSLAAACGTSQTTVLRFCKALSLGGYPQLRVALAAAAGQEDAHRDGRPLGGQIDRDDTLEQIIAKIGYSDARAVEDTIQTLDVDALRQAVDAVAAARRIDIYGIGASAFVGADLHQKLHRIGRLAFAWLDPHAALTSAALLGPGDVAIGISHTGSTVATVAPLDLARTRGATTVALTNHHPSPITEAADIVLSTVAGETTFRSGAMASRIAQLTVIDCLFVGVAQRHFDMTLAALRSTFDAVRGQRTGPRRR